VRSNHGSFEKQQEKFGQIDADMLFVALKYVVEEPLD
jgi:hypothetical protein